MQKLDLGFLAFLFRLGAVGVVGLHPDRSAKRRFMKEVL
jgi:hypothetical protein